MSSMAKKMAERTSGIQAEPTKKGPAAKENVPVTATGRLLDAQMRVNGAIDRAESAEARATAAESEAEALRSELTSARERLQSLQGTQASDAGVSEIDITTLVEKPGRRRILSPTEYAELKANLAVNALIHPIVYRPLGDGRNEIVSGANRVKIYREELGRQTILGVPFTGDEKQAELGATFSNLLAPSLPDFEKYRQFARLQAEFGLSRQDIISASGLSTSHVARILAFDKLSEAARELIAKRPDRVGGNAAEEFAALSSAGNEEAVVSAIKALVDDETMTQKRALEMARQKPAKKPQVSGRAINIGRKKLCEVTVRSGVVGVRFAGKEVDGVAEKWADKIEAFIRAEIANEE